MTLSLLNLAAYSVQLAVLVGMAAGMVALVGITRPAVMLRFWQTVFVSSLVWPAYQLMVSLDVSRQTFAGGALLSAAASRTAETATGRVLLDAGGTTLIIATLAAGAALRLGWLGVGFLRLRSIRAASERAHALLSMSASMQRSLGVSADVRLSDEVTGPATVGRRHPIVLLPRRVADLALTVQHAVLCHELIHVRRRDWWPGLVEELWCAVLWFHPGARALASRLSLARETLVDEATLAHTRDRRAYAAALLEFSGARPHLPGTPALIGRRQLEHRIALITQEVSMPRSSLTVRMALAAGAVVVASLATAAYVPMGTVLQAQSDKVYKPGRDAGVVLPRVVKEAKPYYTAAAMQAKIQGTVWMSIVVLATGDVGDVVVTESLDKEHGLDEAAVEAARQWKFEPGKKDGKPVPVEVTVEMTFTLKK